MRFQIPRLLLKGDVQETLEARFFPRLAEMGFQKVGIGISLGNQNRCELFVDFRPGAEDEKLEALSELMEYLKGASGIATWDYRNIRGKINDVAVFRPGLIELAEVDIVRRSDVQLRTTAAASGLH